MSLPQSVADVIGEHVAFQTESIDRMYLNVYQPMLQKGGGVAHFFRRHRGEVFATAMVNHYYFYCVDKEFGPFFLKFCSYFPHNARLCINGHEYAKRQLARAGIGYDAPDNAILACDDPATLQQIANGLSPAKVEALLRRWLARLPHPYTPADRRAGFLYELSILQAEFSLTQVLKRPLAGRVFFERVIQDNLDLGRPRNVQLIFGRKVQKNTRSRFRTRVITPDVIPSLWVDYKSSTIKQYFKQQRALRTETTINDTRDFRIGRKIENLPALRELAFSANRRLLDVQKLDHDPTVGQDQFDGLTRPAVIDGQRVSGLKFGDPVVLAVLSALLIFRLVPWGFSNRELRDHVAKLLARIPDEFTPGQMTYHLRRLRLKGLIAKLPGTNRYAVTTEGLQAALFFTTSHSVVIRPLASQLQSADQTLQQQLLASVSRLYKRSHAA